MAGSRLDNFKGRRGHRIKGRPNKLTRDVKEMILQALQGAGGAAYLEEQARKNPAPFLALVGKVLPLQLTGKDGEPLMPRPVVVQVLPALPQQLEEPATEAEVVPVMSSGE